jgi:MFS family permease
MTAERPPAGSTEPDSNAAAPANGATTATANGDGGRPPRHDPPEEPAEEVGRFHAFNYRNYRLLWLGNAFAGAAQWIQQGTMGWVVYDLTGSGSAIGGMNVMRSLPTLFVPPLAGLAADRFSRNLIVGISQLSLFFVTFLIALDLALGYIEVWHLFIFAALVAAGNAFNMPARQAMVFDLVPRHVVPNAIALNSLASSMTRTLGPMIGGALIVAFGAANNFFIQSFAYLGVMTTVFLIHLPKRTVRQGERRHVLREMVEGYRFILRTPQARLLMLMMLINPLFLIPLHLALIPIFAKEIFEGGASANGIMLSAIGAGGVFGGLLTASLNRVDRRGMMQLIALFVYTLSQGTFALVGVLTGEMWYALPFLVSAGAAETVSNTTNQTVLQLMAPSHLRGRIASALQLNPVFMSVGVASAGFLADVFGAGAVGVGMSAAGFGVVTLIFVFSPRMRELRLSRLAPEGEPAPVRAH